MLRRSNEIEKTLLEVLNKYKPYEDSGRDTRPTTSAIPTGNSAMYFLDTENNPIRINYIHVVKNDVPSSLNGNIFVAIDENGVDHVIRFYGLAGEIAYNEANATPGTTCGNWQVTAIEKMFQEAFSKGHDVTIHAVDSNRGVDISQVEIRLKGGGGSLLDFTKQSADVSWLLAKAGVCRPILENGVETSNPILVESSSLADINNAAKTAATDPMKGIYTIDNGHRSQNASDLEREIKEKVNLSTYINGKMGKVPSRLGESQVVIGDVLLNIPPINIQVSQLRTSHTPEMLGEEPHPLSSYINRIVIKMNVVFSGEHMINNDLKRILLQYKFCPINIIRSPLIFEKVAAEDSYIRSHYSNDNAIPVTMDEYTISSIEGSPDSLLMTMQFSLFNYTSYFNGDTSAKVQYVRADSPSSVSKYYGGNEEASRKQKSKMSLQKDETDAQVLKRIMDFDGTVQLENAIHPYNLYVERILANEKEKYASGHSSVDIIKVARIQNLFRGVESKVDVKDDQSSKLKISLDQVSDSSVFGDSSDIYKFEETIVTLLTEQSSVYFTNIFAWQPIIGYSQPAAQYIGPGETLVSFSTKTNNEAIVRRLLRTYNEQYEQGRLYDDRYILRSSLTALTKTSLSSMQDCLITNISGKPGWYDIKLRFSKNIYAVHELEKNPAGVMDEYWGLQRILSLYDNEHVSENINRYIDLRSTQGFSIRDDKDIFKSQIKQGEKLTTLSPLFKAALSKVLNLVNGFVFDSDKSYDKEKQKYLVFSNGFYKSFDASFDPDTPQDWRNYPIKISGENIIKNLSVEGIVAPRGEVNIWSAELIKIIFNDLDNGPVNEKEMWNFDKLLFGTHDVSYATREALLKHAITNFMGDFPEADIQEPDARGGDQMSLNQLNDWARSQALRGNGDGHVFLLSQKIAGAIKKTLISNGRLDELKKSWNALTYTAVNRDQVTFSFTGTYPEFKALLMFFAAGNPDSEIYEQTAEIFSLPALMPKFLTSFSQAGQDISNEDGLTANVNSVGGDTSSIQNFIFTVIYIDHDAANVQGYIKKIDNYEQELKKMYDDLKKEVDNEKKTGKVQFVRPQAAHRYYPGAKIFINESPVDSGSVGDWFLFNNQTALQNFILETGNAASEAITPFKNTAAWHSVYMERKMGPGFITKLNEDPENPLKIQEAITFDESQKGLAEKATRHVSGDRAKEVGGSIDTRIGTMCSSLLDTIFDRSNEGPDKAPDVPFSSADHLIYAKHYYGRARQVLAYSKGEGYNLSQIQERTIALMTQEARNKAYTGRVDKDLKSTFDETLAQKGVTPGTTKMLMYASESNHSRICSLIIPATNESGVFADGLTQKIPSHSSEKCMEANTEIMGMNKSAKEFSLQDLVNNAKQVAKNGAPQNLPIGSSTYLLEQKKEEIFYWGIYLGAKSDKASDWRQDFDKKTIDSFFSDAYKKIGDEAFEAFSTSFSPEFYPWIEAYDVAYWFLHNHTLPLREICERVITPLKTELLDKGTKDFLSKQYAQSLLPTSGLENAFPTFKMYIIESDTSDIKYYSLDDYYDFRLLQDAMVIRDRDNPAHLFKGRVVIDERYITINQGKNQTSRSPKGTSGEWDGKNLPSTFIDGRIENLYIGSENTSDEETALIGSRIPLREGMRLCIKFGYHSDPRLLDTVFIGTITGLGPTSQKGIYTLEARGDGRELTVPPTEKHVESLSGANFRDIITKILRANPSVVHFGKNYGSWLEKFSRKHYAILALGAVGVPTIGLAGLGLAFGGPMGVFILRGAAQAIGISAARGAVSKMVVGGAVAVGAGANTASYLYMMNKYIGSSLVANSIEALPGKVVKGWKESVHHYWADGNIADQVGEKAGEIKDWAKGSIYNLDKSSKQVGGILYETLRRNNDPIDDNIFAVDIWNNLWNSDVNMTINNKRTIWEVLVDIKRCYPNYALDVRPYGSRSTLYLGPNEFNYWRTDDPLIAMAPQLQELSNVAAARNLNFSKAMEGFVDRDVYGDRILKTEGEGNFGTTAPFIPFQKHHLVSSDGDIISNSIRSTPDRGWNHVVVAYGRGPDDDSYPDPITLIANQGIETGARRTRYSVLDWTDDKQIAMQYSIGLLKEGVEKMYGGTLVLRGNPKIEPYDRIYISDKVNQIFGWIQVDTVIHKFDPNLGFTSHVLPNMVCSVNSDAYSTMSHVTRRHIAASFDKMSGGDALAFGVMLGVGFAASAFATGITGGMAALAAVNVLSIVYSIYNTSQKFGAITEKYEGYTATSREARELYGYVPEILHATSNVSAGVISIQAGAVSGMLIRGFYETIKGRGPIAKAGSFIGSTHDNIVKILKTKVTSYNNAKTLNVFTELLGKDLNGKSPLEMKKTELLKKVKQKIADIENNGNTSEKSKLSKVAGANTQETLNKVASAHAEGNAPVSKKSVAWAERVSKVFPEGTGGKISKFTKTGGFLAIGILTEAMFAALPIFFESLIVNNMTGANIIVIHPLWQRNNFMMSGLEGYKNQHAFMHMNDMIVHAKDVISGLPEVINDHIPLIFNGDSNEPLTEAIGEYKVLKQAQTREKADQENMYKDSARGTFSQHVGPTIGVDGISAILRILADRNGSVRSNNAFYNTLVKLVAEIYNTNVWDQFRISGQKFGPFQIEMSGEIGENIGKVLEDHDFVSQLRTDLDTLKGSSGTEIIKGDTLGITHKEIAKAYVQLVVESSDSVPTEFKRYFHPALTSEQKLALKTKLADFMPFVMQPSVDYVVRCWVEAERNIDVRGSEIRKLTDHAYLTYIGYYSNPGASLFSLDDARQDLAQNFRNAMIPILGNPE